MKKQNHILIPFLLFCLLLASCISSDTKPGDFEITGLKDVVLQKYVSGSGGTLSGISAVTPLNITYSGTAPEYVNLSIANKPAKLGATFSPGEGNIPFSTQMLLIDSNVAIGDYYLTLNANAASGRQKSYSFKLSIKGPPACTEAFVGNYNSNSSSDPQTSYTISRISDSIVAINNFANTGNNLNLKVYCSNYSITVVQQTMTINNVSYTLTGNGSYYLANTGFVYNMSLYVYLYNAQSGNTYRSYSMYRQN